ncbi:MAG: 30S ribosomal protein S13 [Candidatus Nanohaloarchaeota archaeon QJJ-9]|nr:30S ribosomal protein S13 [Candidatus Nanohaloarchaeota archaeon QJJ-9]
MSEQKIQEIVRIAKTDINGKKRIADGITSIKGVGDAYANAVCKSIEIDKEKKIGDLSEEEIEKIKEVIENPEEYNIPAFLRNRRKDRETGEDKHIIGADLELKQQFDIKRMKEIDSYKGWRHDQGLPVRGQKTQSSFRTGSKVGVSRERVKEEAEEEEEE